MHVRFTISVLALLCLAAPVLAQQKIDKQKVLAELEMPKATMRMTLTVGGDGEPREPECYLPAETRVKNLKSRLSALDPKTPSEEKAKLYMKLGETLRESGSRKEGNEFLESAVKEYKALLQKDKNNPQLVLGLSSVYCAMSEIEKSREILVNLLEANPDVCEAYSRLLPSEPMESMKEKPLFEKWSKRGEDHFARGFKEGRTDAKFYVEYARFHFMVEVGRFFIKAEEEKTGSSPENDVEWMKGHFGLFTSEKSFRIVERALELDSKKQLCHIWLGGMHAFEAATLWFEKAMVAPDGELSDEEIRANMNKLSGEVCTSKAKEIEAAQKHLLATYESKAFAYIQLWENLLWLQMLKGDWQKYEQYLLEAIKNHPGYARFYCTLLWFYLIAYDNKGNDRDAKIRAVVKLIEERNKICPDAELHFLCGKAKHELDDSAEALKEFDAAVKLSPGHIGANLGKAVLLMKTGKLKQACEAIEYADKNVVVKRHEDSVHAYLTVAILNMLKEEYDSARQLLDEVLKAVPDNARAKRLRAMLGD